jgi:hypothetical protein
MEDNLHRFAVPLHGSGRLGACSGYVSDKRDNRSRSERRTNQCRRECRVV